MPEEARKKRYEWLDVLKFMGMLEIYIAHMGTVSGKLLPLMFVFNVQLFFFMSGLFYRPPQKGQLRGYLVDKVCGILVPYFLFSFYYYGAQLHPSRFRAFQIQVSGKVLDLGAVHPAAWPRFADPVRVRGFHPRARQRFHQHLRAVHRHPDAAGLGTVRTFVSRRVRQNLRHAGA